MFIRHFLSRLPKPLNLSLVLLAVLFLFALVLGLCFFSPVYYDDIRYPMGASRAVYDHFGAISTTPYCTSTFYTAMPLLFWPARWLAWAVHSATGDSFLLMRLYGLLIFSAWAAYMSWLIRRYLMPHWPWLYAAGAVAAVSSIGCVPLLLLNMRPDMGLLICVTFFVSLPLVFREKKTLSRRQQAYFLVGVALVATWCFSAHPKALLYLPLMLVGCAYIPFERKWAKVALMGFLMLASMQGNAYWSARTRCPDDDKEMMMRHAQAINPQGLVDLIDMKVDAYLDTHPEIERTLFDAANALEQEGMTLKDRLGRYAMMAGVTMVYLFPFFSTLISALLLNDLNSFLYVRRMMFHHSLKWRLEIDYTVVTAMADLAISCMALYMLFIIVKSVVWVVRTSTREDFREPRFVVLFTLLGCMLLQAGIQVAKNFYELSFVWPCLFLFCMLLAALPYWRDAVRARENKHLLALALVSVASQLVFLASYGPATFREYRAVDANGVLLSNHFLLSPFNYGEVEKRIVALAAKCGIADDGSSRHVMVDPLSYNAMRATSQPFLYRLTFRSEIPDGKDKVFKLLQTQDSSGIVMQCRYIPEGLRGQALEDNGLCCMGREAVRAVPVDDKLAH